MEEVGLKLSSHMLEERWAPRIKTEKNNVMPCRCPFKNLDLDAVKSC